MGAAAFATAPPDAQIVGWGFFLELQKIDSFASLSDCWKISPSLYACG
jgi:hypothetical protein